MNIKKDYLTHQGVMLIELMLAMILSLGLVCTLVSLVLGAERSLSLQQALNTLNSHAQSAIQILHAQIHQTGTVVCGKVHDKFSLMRNGKPYLNENNKIQGSANTLSVAYSEPDESTLLGINQDKTLLVLSEPYFTDRDQLLISDCEHAELLTIHHVSRKNHQQELFISPLTFTYGPHAKVARFIQAVFFVKKNQPTSYLDGNVQGALMQQMNGKTIELVPGIDRIHFEYVTANKKGFLKSDGAYFRDVSHLSGIQIRLDLSTPPFKKVVYTFVVL